MKLFALIITSAILGLASSIILYKMFNIDVPPLFTGLSINIIGYLLFKEKINDDTE